jgi:hypothetical protein
MLPPFPIHANAIASSGSITISTPRFAMPNSRFDNCGYKSTLPYQGMQVEKSCKVGFFGLNK